LGTFFGGFWDETKETNICKMTKKGQKMSFHARKVEIMAKIGIMEIVIDFTEQLNKTLVCNTEWRNLIW